LDVTLPDTQHTPDSQTRFF